MRRDAISYSFISIVQKSEFQDIRTGNWGNRGLELDWDWIRGNTTTKVGPPTTLPLPPPPTTITRTQPGLGYISSGLRQTVVSCLSATVVDGRQDVTEKISCFEN